MAILARVETHHGEERELYIRLDHFERLNNHGAPALAVFRGYISKEAFDARAAFVWELGIELEANAPEKPWELAYSELQKMTPVPQLEAVAAAQADLIHAEQALRIIDHQVATLNEGFPEGADSAGRSANAVQALAEAGQAMGAQAARVAAARDAVADAEGRLAKAGKLFDALARGKRV